MGLECLVGLPECLVDSLVMEVGGSQAHNNTVGILRPQSNKICQKIKYTMSRKSVLWIRIRIHWAVLDPVCIGNTDPDPGAWKLTKIYKYEARPITNSNVLISGVVFLNIPAILSADVLLAAFFTGSSVLLIYFPKSDPPVTPSRYFYYQRQKFSFKPFLHF
jgi:hypothetical protein